MANKTKFQDTVFKVGDTVKVDYKIIEKEKVSGVKKKEEKEEIRERVQPFEGVVLAVRGEKENITFTVRKITKGGIGVERIFPVNSPWITRIAVKKRGNSRRAKLYYLRNKQVFASQ